jgi:hypothetical protein
VIDNSTTEPGLILHTGHTSDIDDSCTGYYYTRKCTIHAAIKEYSAMMTWSDVTHTNAGPHFITKYTSEGDFLAVPRGVDAGPLTGMNYVLGEFFRAWGVLEDVNTTNSNNMATLFWNPEDECKLNYNDPTDYILSRMNDFMLFAGLTAARIPKGSLSQPAQRIAAQRSRPTLLYEADYRFLAATLAIMVAGLLFVALLLLGWWGLDHLGATLSPIETARAFAAPLLFRGGDVPTDVDDTLKEVGHVKVKYNGNVIVADERENDKGTDLSLLQ